MALIKCTECGQMISDKATKCPKCGCPIGRQTDKESDKWKEKTHESASESKNYLLYILGAVVILGIAGYFFFNRSSSQSPNEDVVANPVSVDSVSTNVDSAESSPKEEITKSLGKLFDDVMKGTIHEYDKRYFSSDFNRIYKEVDEIDKRFAQEGLIGFWDFGFWDMAQDEVKMNIALNDVYNIKDNEAMTKVTFKITSGGDTETRNEEIKVILENGKWVLDDVHGYKKQMKEFVQENKNYQPSEEVAFQDDDQEDISTQSPSSNSSFHFSTAYDVTGYLADKSFYSSNRRLRIRENGIWINDMCVTGAPHVERFETWKALIRAYTPTGQRLSFLIDPVHSLIIDEEGVEYHLK